MAQPLLSSEARRACALGGIQNQLVLENRLITLRALEKTLQVAVQDAQSAATSETFWRGLELATKLGGVSCDLGVAYLGDKLGIPGQAVSTTYDVAKLVVDALNGDLSLKKAFIFSGGVKLDAIVELVKMRGNEKAANTIKVLKVLAATVDDLRDYWEAHSDDKMGPSGILSAKRTAQGVLDRLRAQILDLEDSLAACSPESGASLSSSK